MDSDDLYWAIMLELCRHLETRMRNKERGDHLVRVMGDITASHWFSLEKCAEYVEKNYPVKNVPQR